MDTRLKKRNVLFLSLLIAHCTLHIVSCTFNYGDSDSSNDEMPDLVMENVQYVRVRSSDPIAWFSAERAERYDNLGVMKITNFSFEQYGEDGVEINAFGTAGFASVNIETGDIFMDNGVLVDVQAEDIIISTGQLEWFDEDKIFSTGEQNEVNILQHNGTNFTGMGLLANARSRTWEFTGNVSGIYIHDSEDEDDESSHDDIFAETPAPTEELPVQSEEEL